MMAIGACGLMNAVGNLRPRVLSDLCEARVARRPEDRAGSASSSARSQQGDFLRHQSDPDQQTWPSASASSSATSIDLPMVPAMPELEKRLDGVLTRAPLSSEAAEWLRPASATSLMRCVVAGEGIIDVRPRLPRHHTLLE